MVNGKWRLILLAAVVGLVVRLAFGFGYWVGKPLTHDEREYLALASSIAAGRGFAYDSSHETGTAQQYGRAPLYPLFLAAIGARAGDYESAPAAVKIAQALLGAGGVVLIGLIGLQSIGPRGGALAAGLAAVYPPLVWMCAYVLSETLYSVLALAAALLLDGLYPGASPPDPRHAHSRGPHAPLRPGRRGAKRGGDSRGARLRSWHARASARQALAALVRFRRWVLHDRASAGRDNVRIRVACAAVLTGAGVLTRPVMLFFVPLAVLWMWRRRRAALAAIFVGLAAAVVAPWTVRNVRVHDRFVLVASEGGVTFWTGNHPLAVGEGDLAANPGIKRAEIEFRRAHPGLSAEQLEPLYYREALAYIADHPMWWAGLLARKAFYTVVPIGPSYTLHSRKYLAASVASYGLLLPFAVAGGLRLARSARAPTALWLLAGSVVLAGLVFFPQERFRIPVIDPTLIVCAAGLSHPRDDHRDSTPPADRP